MADPLIHLKDAYFFEVPRFLWPRHYRSRAEFPDVWVRLDDDFQLWQARHIIEELPKLVDTYKQALQERGVVIPAPETLLERYLEWKHQPANHGKPLPVYLEEWQRQFEKDYRAWVSKAQGLVDRSPQAYLEVRRSSNKDVEHYWFVELSRQSGFRESWQALCKKYDNVTAYKNDPSCGEWSAEKIEAYNYHLSGKILIPQPFGQLRNLHEPQSGICISKFMVIQFFVVVVLFLCYRWLAVRVATGQRPRGKCWNLLEVLLFFVRDHIARPALGSHDAERFLPLLWSMFLFILGSNLCGMLPGVGAPTSSWGVTLAMAVVTLTVGMGCGMWRFGVLGFFLNMIPHMELPKLLGLLLKPFILLIELLSFAIKHLVLSIRLLANMVAGHLVLLGILGLAFGAEAALQWLGLPRWQWYMTAAISVVGCALFSVLELFVAFLQAYIFTFLSALFIGAAIHHH
jgi:F-type H+-transporting ATPase subunit a